MKTITSILCACALAALSAGCVSRTTSVGAQNRGASVGGEKGYGSESNDDVISKKIVWIWQKEFYNPK